MSPLRKPKPLTSEHTVNANHNYLSTFISTVNANIREQLFLDYGRSILLVCESGMYIVYTCSVSATLYEVTDFLSVSLMVILIDDNNLWR